MPPELVRITVPGKPPLVLPAPLAPTSEPSVKKFEIVAVPVALNEPGPVTSGLLKLKVTVPNVPVKPLVSMVTCNVSAATAGGRRQHDRRD